MTADYRLDNPELLGQLRDNTADEIAAATRFVRTRAVDDTDAGYLLGIVGLGGAA